MAIGRMVPPVVLLVALAGFSPGACARGCSGACSKSSGTLGRSAMNSADDLARRAPHLQPYGADRLARGHASPHAVPGGGPRPIVIPGHVVGDDVGLHVMRSGLDDMVAALPPVEGSASALAKAPATNGATLAPRAGGRSLADDYARSIDELGLTRQEHQKILDVFDATQATFEAAADAGAGADPAGAPPSPTERELARLDQVAEELRVELVLAIGVDKYMALFHRLGSPRLIAYRISRERPMQRPGAASASAGSASASAGSASTSAGAAAP